MPASCGSQVSTLRALPVEVGTGGRRDVMSHIRLNIQAGAKTSPPRLRKAGRRSPSSAMHQSGISLGSMHVAPALPWSSRLTTRVGVGRRNMP
jgi:hypothetical protein